MEWQKDGRFLGFTDYERNIRKRVMEEGGWFNAHAHIDRANIIDPKYLEHEGCTPINVSALGLRAKQNLTGKLHSGLAYTEADFKQRVGDQLDVMVDVLGVSRLDTMVDCTTDVGSKVFEWMEELRKSYSERGLKINLGTHTTFGFKNSEPDRWELYKELSGRADFIGALPERDIGDSHIGYQASLRRSIELSLELGKELQVHIGQPNHPADRSVDSLVSAVEWYGVERDSPKIWAVHAISPACYDEKRFNDLADKMAALDIGVICCPRAAISMLQHTEVSSPIHNSIAPILKFLSKGVDVRIGSDNIADPFIPSGNPDLYREIEFFVDSQRCYLPDVAVKLATGRNLNDTDRDNIENILYQSEKARSSWRQPIFEDWKR